MSATSSPQPRVTVHARHRCHDAGVVLDFAHVAMASGDEPGHRRAAVAGVAEIVAAAAERMEPAMRMHGSPPEAIDGLRRRCADAASASPDALTGRRVSLARFYGPAFDTATGTLSGAPVPNDGDRDFSARGFVVALLKPPYGIKPNRAGYAGEHELLTDVITGILHTPTAGTPIWHWTGDWCPYFDAGREWWGAGAWTLESRPGEILLVAASSTD